MLGEPSYESQSQNLGVSLDLVLEARTAARRKFGVDVNLLGPVAGPVAGCGSGSGARPKVDIPNSWEFFPMFGHVRFIQKVDGQP
ncbi:MAG: hypothetical protein CMB99_00175 [Flavobacteriaceae bacterium]|nr:hypothetical protein [Flavobacteriaceae bacterium]